MMAALFVVFMLNGAETCRIWLIHISK